MRKLLIGIDSSTQSTKALVVHANTGTGKVLGSGSAKHDLIPGFPPTSRCYTADRLKASS